MKVPDHGGDNLENLKVKITIPGDPKRKPSDLFLLTLQKLNDWIDAKPIDERVKVELKKMAAGWPQQTLKIWQKSFTKHLSTVQNMLHKQGVVFLPKKKDSNEKPKTGYEEFK